MGKKKTKSGKRNAQSATSSAAEAGGAAALVAFLSQPIVKDLVVKAMVAGATALARSERVRRAMGRAPRTPD